MTTETVTHTPWLWLQEDETEGAAQCGCNLVREPYDSEYETGPAFYICRVHEAATELLEALEAMSVQYMAFIDQCCDEAGKAWHNRRLAAAREVIAKARGR